MEVTLEIVNEYIFVLRYNKIIVNKALRKIRNDVGKLGPKNLKQYFSFIFIILLNNFGVQENLL